MKSHVYFACAQAVCLALIAHADDPGSVSPDVVRRAYAQLQPAIGLVEYTSEITNTTTGNVTRRSGNCLGLVVSSDGLLMAFGHLMLENSEPVNLRVTLGQGDGGEHMYDGKTLKKPGDVNVTFIRLQSDAPLNLPYAHFEPAALRLNDPVALVGILGSAMDNIPSVQHRRIGAILERPRTTYCLDERVAFGYVGGPVIDTAGRVVGVVGFDLSSEEGGELYVRSGHPLVYQAELFSRYIMNPMAEDVADDEEGTAWLGILSQPLTDDLAIYWNLPQNGGVVVSTVVPGSPAEAAGFQVGDILQEFNGHRLDMRVDRDVRAFTKIVRESPLGTPVAVSLLRDGERVDLEVTLRDQPKSRGEAGEFESTLLGLTVREITADMRLMLNLPENINGVIIRRVRPGSPAQVAGIRSGVIVLNFGNYPITSLEDFEKAVAALGDDKPSEISVLGLLPTGRQFYRIEPRW